MSFFLSTGFSAFSTFFSTGLLRGDGGCRPMDVKAFKACGGLTCRELCTACGKKWACFFCRHRMTGGKVRLFRWETGGRNPKNGGENVENITPSSGLRFYPFSIGYPVVFHRFSTRFSTPVSALKKYISGARFRLRGRWRRVRKGNMEDGRRRGTGGEKRAGSGASDLSFSCSRAVVRFSEKAVWRKRK